MLTKIPWEIIGPVSAGVVVILGIVFGFILKFQKQSKSSPPRDINSTGKKTLCFEHHSGIAENKKAVEMIGEQLNTVHENNREDHNKLETKIETLGKDIIQAIDENSIRE